MSIIERVETLYLCRGRRCLIDTPDGPMTVLDHGLQTAQLAEWDGADDTLVAAAFLHDLGRLLPLPPDADRIDDVHELRAVAYLAEAFAAPVIEPIRLHVQAKRYIASRQRGHEPRLSAASQVLLGLQGGPMTPFEQVLFEALPFADEAIRVRQWDDAARLPGRRTAPLGWYLHLLAGLDMAQAPLDRLQIASTSVT